VLDEREPALNLESARSADGLELEAQHRGRLLREAELEVRVRECSGDACGHDAVVEQGLGGLARPLVLR
jgi:hypothetical protein